jgi:hypothetical protein
MSVTFQFLEIQIGFLLVKIKELRAWKFYFDIQCPVIVISLANQQLLLIYVCLHFTLNSTSAKKN